MRTISGERPASRRGGRAKAAVSDRDPDEKLTIDEVCLELKISRSTFYDWRQKRRGPRCIRLPNGALRVRRRDFDEWLAGQEVA
jgi:predicted DNA-binding transcriptional regulator AlpA